MGILLAHPTTGHSPYSANVLHGAGLLQLYVTSFHYRSGGRIEKFVHMMPEKAATTLHRKLLRRRRAAIPEYLIKELPLIELANRLYLKFANRPDRHWGFRTFDRFVSGVLSSDYSGYYGYLTSSLYSMRRAKALGLPRFLTMPICHWDLGRRLMHDEYARWGLEREYEEPYPWVADRFDVEMTEELDLANVIVAGSEFVVDSLVQNGISENKVLLNPSGVDLSLYTQKDARSGFHFDRRHRRQRPFRIISVGKLGLRKGTLDLLAAAQQLGSSVEVRLLGGNDLPQRLQKQYWGGNIEHVGHLPYLEVPSMLRWADAFVFPTIFEGSSLASYEALAAGLPVITTPNCGSVVRDGIDGWLIPIRSPDAICSAVTRLMEDEDMWLRMSNSASQRAREFTWERYGETLVSALTPHLALES